MIYSVQSLEMKIYKTRHESYVGFNFSEDFVRRRTTSPGICSYMLPQQLHVREACYGPLCTFHLQPDSENRSGQEQELREMKAGALPAKANISVN